MSSGCAVPYESSVALPPNSSQSTYSRLWPVQTCSIISSWLPSRGTRRHCCWSASSRSITPRLCGAAVDVVAQQDQRILRAAARSAANSVSRADRQP